MDVRAMARAGYQRAPCSCGGSGLREPAPFSGSGRRLYRLMACEFVQAVWAPSSEGGRALRARPAR
eukprot:942536-Pyramimonas_sp.AAC.1